MSTAFLREHRLKQLKEDIARYKKLTQTQGIWFAIRFSWFTAISMYIVEYLFGNMQKALEDKGIAPISAELEWVPTTTVSLDEEQAQDVLKLVDKLEQDEDVQKVFYNLA